MFEFICPFFIFGMACLMVLIGLAKTFAAKSRKARRRGRIIWISGAVVLGLLTFAGYRMFVDEGLIQAVSSGSVEDVKAMLSFGADPNTTNEGGVPAIVIAKQFGRATIVKILREAGAKE
jgi:amino acid permease